MTLNDLTAMLIRLLSRLSIGPKDFPLGLYVNLHTVLIRLPFFD